MERKGAGVIPCKQMNVPTKIEEIEQRIVMFSNKGAKVETNQLLEILMDLAQEVKRIGLNAKPEVENSLANMRSKGA